MHRCNVLGLDLQGKIPQRQFRCNGHIPFNQLLDFFTREARGLVAGTNFLVSFFLSVYLYRTSLPSFLKDFP